MNTKINSRETGQPFSEPIPVMSSRQFIAWINPKIIKAVSNIQKRKKKRTETLLFLTGYYLIILIAGSVYLDYRTNGMHNNVLIYLYAVAVISFGLVLYIPLIIKLQKTNWIER